MSTISIIAGVVLILLLLSFIEGGATELSRRAKPEGETPKPQLKAVWQFIGVALYNAILIPAFVYGGHTGAISATALSIAAYGVFRYQLARSPAFQQRFLSQTLASKPGTPQSRRSDSSDRSDGSEVSDVSE